MILYLKYNYFTFKGLPANDSTKWQSFRDSYNQIINESWESFNQWVMSEGCPSLPKNSFRHESPHLNIYAYPRELDYLDQRPLPAKWKRFDSFVRFGGGHFDLPEKLVGKPGKLVYFSMGTMGSVGVDLMKRIVNILAKSPHRFIVAKGNLV